MTLKIKNTIMVFVGWTTGVRFPGGVGLLWDPLNHLSNNKR